MHVHTQNHQNTVAQGTLTSWIVVEDAAPVEAADEGQPQQQVPAILLADRVVVRYYPHVTGVNHWLVPKRGTTPTLDQAVSYHNLLNIGARFMTAKAVTVARGKTRKFIRVHKYSTHTPTSCRQGKQVVMLTPTCTCACTPTAAGRT